MTLNWRAYLAELIGTFALVFFGSASVTIFVVVLGFASPGAALLGIALTHGLVLMAMVYTLGPISRCHINPAVTISIAGLRKITPPDAVLYIVFQLLGASVAGLTHSVILPMGRGVNFGLTFPTQNIGGNPNTATLIEAIITFFLVLAVLSTALSGKAAPGVTGISIGMTLTLGILFAGPLTGGAANPARAFGPGIASGALGTQWVYWLGPIVGGLIAAATYDYLFAEGK